MSNSTIELNQDSSLAIRAVLIQQDVRYLREKITRLERLIERLAERNSEGHIWLFEKISAVECRVIRGADRC